MAWLPQVKRLSDNAVFVLPPPVNTVSFAGSNAIREAAIPLVAGVMITAVYRTGASISLSGIITGTKITPDIADLTSVNKETIIAAIHTMKATMEAFFYVPASIDEEFIVYLDTSSLAHLFCNKCRLSSLDFNESPTTLMAIPYTLNFSVPDGLLRYERAAV